MTEDFLSCYCGSVGTFAKKRKKEIVVIVKYDMLPVGTCCALRCVRLIRAQTLEAATRRRQRRQRPATLIPRPPTAPSKLPFF
jgi:hypothetical protein